RSSRTSAAARTSTPPCRWMRCRCPTGATDRSQTTDQKTPTMAGFFVAGLRVSGRQRSIDGRTQGRAVSRGVRREAADDAALLADEELLEVPHHRRRIIGGDVEAAQLFAHRALAGGHR